jgi:hypothetical protein
VVYIYIYNSVHDTVFASGLYIYIYNSVHDTVFASGLLSKYLGELSGDLCGLVST